MRSYFREYQLISVDSKGILGFTIHETFLQVFEYRRIRCSMRYYYQSIIGLIQVSYLI